MDKQICLECGGYYPLTEIVNTICVWCSLSAKMKLSPDSSDVVHKDLNESTVEYIPPK